MRILLCLCCVLTLGGEEAEAAPVPLADPIGLGERLVLIEHLRQEHGEDIPAGATLEELRRRYWHLQEAGNTTAHDDARQRDALARMREAILRRFHHQPAEDLDLAGLIALRETLIAESLAEVAAMVAADRADRGERTPDLRQVIARARAATVLIAGDNRLGSGFFVCPSGTLVSNHHVTPILGAVVTVAWDADLKRRPERFRVERLDADRDTALLRPLAPAPPYPALQAGPVPELGQAVIACGFPLGTTVGAQLGTNAVDISLHRGSITALRRRGDALWLLQSDCALTQGNSGGPLIDEATGAVIGMIQSGLDPHAHGAMGSAMIFAIPMNAVRDSLDLR